MKTFVNQLRTFLNKPLGMVAFFVVLFYLVTFLVYSFYSPGPEERLQAQAEISSINP